MSLVADLEFPLDAVVLADTLGEFPDVAVELDAIVPAGQPAPYLWMSGATATAFEARARNDPTVAALTTLDRFDDETLYRVAWNDCCPLFRSIRGDEAILRCEGSSTGWEVRLRFDSRDSFDGFLDDCEEHGIRFRLSKLHDLVASTTDEFDVTDAQCDALLTAKEMGYFEVPRGCTLDEIAEALDISPRAVSERLRRGQSNLIENAL